METLKKSAPQVSRDENAQAPKVEAPQGAAVVLKIDSLVKVSATNAKVTEAQFIIALVTLAKLKNYFSDKERAYRLATNHKPALKSILEYITTNKVTTQDAMKDFVYSVRKESGRKAVDDATIERCNTITIAPRATTKKDLKEIIF